MNPKFRMTMAACAAALVAVACGGGGGGSSSAPALKLSGTAATGLALAGGSVQVKCAQGSGTATTDANGGYSMTITGGALPCVIEVSGTTGGVAVTLHSLAEAGTASGTDTNAQANVTPLTEMVVAQLTGALPQDLFSSFGSGVAITSDQLRAATTAVLTVLRDVVGIDLTSIDPFKAPLVAASGSSTTGNTYDQLLDALGDKLSIEALPLVVTQIATTAAAGTGSGTTLTDVMTAVDAGTMPGCPTALSGKYRAVEYHGRTYVRQIDFKNSTFNSGDGTLTATLAIDAAKPCQFVATGKNSSGNDVEWSVFLGPQGAGGFRVRNLTTGGNTIGHLFPVQAQTAAALQGSWTMLQSGYFPSTSGTGGAYEHSVSKLEVPASGNLQICDYPSVANPTCTPADSGLQLAARGDGGFDLVEGTTQVAQVYGFRNPAGALTVFGTTNPTGATATTVEQSHFVGTRPRVLPLPALNTVSRFWNLAYTRPLSGTPGTSAVADATTVTAVDTATSTITRTQSSDGRVDTVRVNYPVDGLRLRPAGTYNNVSFAEAIQLPLQSGSTITINTDPQGTFFYNLSVGRP